MLVVDSVGLALRADVMIDAYAALVAHADHLLAALLAREVVDSVGIVVDFCRTIVSIVSSLRIDVLLELDKILVELLSGIGPVEDLKRVFWTSEQGAEVCSQR